MATSIKLDDATTARVRALSERRERSAHWIMREAIREYVEREEARDSFHEEALASWNEFRETGRHLTLAETTKWLRGWGTDKESELPECHE